MFCPECGDKLDSFYLGGEGTCYFCSKCGIHWEYVDGSYTNTDDCSFVPTQECLGCHHGGH